MVQDLVSGSCHIQLSAVEVGNARREVTLRWTSTYMYRGWSEMSSCYMKENLELSAGIPIICKKKKMLMWDGHQNILPFFTVATCRKKGQHITPYIVVTLDGYSFCTIYFISRTY